MLAQAGALSARLDQPAGAARNVRMQPPFSPIPCSHQAVLCLAHGSVAGQPQQAQRHKAVPHDNTADLLRVYLAINDHPCTPAQLRAGRQVNECRLPVRAQSIHDQRACLQVQAPCETATSRVMEEPLRRHAATHTHVHERRLAGPGEWRSVNNFKLLP